MAIKFFNFSTTPWTQNVDVYCERLAAGFGAEPVNLYSTAAYVIAAYLAYQFGKRKETLDQSTMGLLWAMIMVALCGFIFHRYSSVWAMYLDNAPMYAFHILFVYLYSSFITRASAKPQLTPIFITLGFVVLTLLTGLLPRSTLNGGATFIPLMIFMLIFAYYHNHNVRRNTAIVWLSLIAWIIAIFMKSIDIEACDYQRFGTHSIWHVTSAAAMLFSVIGLLATKEDGRHLRSKSVQGHYRFEKIEAIESLNPHDAVGFDETTLSMTRPNFQNTTTIMMVEKAKREFDERIAAKKVRPAAANENAAKKTKPETAKKDVVEKTKPQVAKKEVAKNAQPKVAKKKIAKKTRAESANPIPTKKAPLKATKTEPAKKPTPQTSAPTKVAKQVRRDVEKKPRPAPEAKVPDNVARKVAKKVRRKVEKKAPAVAAPADDPIDRLATLLGAFAKGVTAVATSEQPEINALVVDDSKVARVHLAKLLASENMICKTAESAEAMLKYLKIEHPDVIFLDHNMPGMSGLEGLAIIKSNPSTEHIPVMMYTSEADEVYLEKARALGALDVLVKK